MELAGDVDVAVVASLLADRGRAKMLLALGDGRALTATTLAMEAGVAPSTASVHLAKLVSSGLCRVETSGRHRYFRLAGPEVGELLEVLSRLAPPRPVRSLRDGTRAQAIRSARTCYDHLAGKLGTAVMAALLEQGILVGGDGPSVDYRLSDTGEEWMNDFGVKVASGSRRPFIRACVDWSEQRHHLAGAFGAGLLVCLLDRDWVRRAASSRAIGVTEAGRGGFGRYFGIDLP